MQNMWILCCRKCYQELALEAVATACHSWCCAMSKFCHYCNAYTMTFHTQLYTGVQLFRSSTACRMHSAAACVHTGFTAYCLETDDACCWERGGGVAASLDQAPTMACQSGMLPAQSGHCQRTGAHWEVALHVPPACLVHQRHPAV